MLSPRCSLAPTSPDSFCRHNANAVLPDSGMLHPDQDDLRQKHQHTMTACSELLHQCKCNAQMCVAGASRHLLHPDQEDLFAGCHSGDQQCLADYCNLKVDREQMLLHKQPAVVLASKHKEEPDIDRPQIDKNGGGNH